MNKSAGKDFEDPISSKKFKKDPALTIEDCRPLRFEVGDELIIHQCVQTKSTNYHSGVWTISAIDTNHNILLQLLYGRETKNLQQIDELEDRCCCFCRSISHHRLIEMIKTSRAQHIKVNELTNHNSSLQKICMKIISKDLSILPPLQVLPSHLQREICSLTEIIEPIPIECTFRCLVKPHVDIEKKAGKLERNSSILWTSETWKFCPEALSYAQIWQACAARVLPFRPSQLPQGTILSLHLTPSQGHAAFMREYVEACNRRESAFKLAFDQVWMLLPCGDIAPAGGQI